MWTQCWIFFSPTFSRLVLVFSLWFFVRCPIFVLLLSETKTSFSETAKFFKSWWLMRRISSLLDDDGGDSSETIPSSSVLSSVFDSLSGISPKKTRQKSWKCPLTAIRYINRWPKTRCEINNSFVYVRGCYILFVI